MALESENREAKLQKLDEEIEEAEARVEALQYLLKVQVANTLATRYTDDDAQPRPDAHALQELCEVHEARDQQCVYRICAGVTAFKVRDPDPNAVDGGTVLGLRFEVMSKAQFCRPYFVMLNRPYPASKFLTVHKHTVPPCIPLSGLARRHLPPPPAADAIGGDKVRQDMSLFARCLRKEILRYHNRVGAIADIRRDIGITDGRASGEESWIVNVGAVDPEAKQVRLEWANGRSGRVVMDDDGVVRQVVVFGPEGRDRETMRALSEGNLRIEELAGKLTQLRQKEWQREIDLERHASVGGSEDGEPAGTPDEWQDETT
ncbi:uncharacterized protein DNG_02892 [Cephalotrichum gorgonifer]|uniref:Cenp-O kinetochore centromere component n=1 Tax=Cephalotrichum gorgonifer TaxID=2041049 RepID=A0AAE8MVZ2_9PEZI|nr:uncharacterized protein DNG_02892 [Cephalotrichum gorgonifer]